MATKKTVKKAKTPAKASTTKAASKTTTKKTATKATAKPAQKTAVKSTTVAAPAKVTPEKETKTTAKDSSEQTIVKLRKPYVILIVIIVILGAALYWLRGLVVAAVVNGQPISRLEVIQQAEKQSGKQTLDTLVRDALIEQEAKKENVTVSDKEVSDEITTLQDNLKKQGQTLNDVLATQGLTQDDLKGLIRLNKLVQKMVGKNIKVSDQEVTDYINKNKGSLPTTDAATLRSQVKSQLLQQKTNEAIQSWLANLQSKANIVYFVQY
jgi:foldase protein PrsA